MINNDVRELITDRNPNAILFENPSFDNSIVGFDETSDVVIYSLTKMIEELAKDDNITEEEAMDFISYNTVRALLYVSSENKPIVMDDLYFTI